MPIATIFPIIGKMNRKLSMLGKPGTLRRMKAIDIPKAKKRIRQYRNSPFITGALGKTDLQAAVAGAENNPARCMLLLFLFAKDIDPTLQGLFVAFFLIVLLAYFVTLAVYFRKVRDYLIENNLQNLDEVKR